jgi:hypothetical protein
MLMCILLVKCSRTPPGVENPCTYRRTNVASALWDGLARAGAVRCIRTLTSALNDRTSALRSGDSELCESLIQTGRVPQPKMGPYPPTCPAWLSTALCGPDPVGVIDARIVATESSLITSALYMALCEKRYAVATALCSLGRQRAFCTRWTTTT